jgi:hypothetical protein
VSVAVRGYRMTEVDWLLEQLAQALEERDEVIAALRAERDDAGRTSPPGASGDAAVGEGRDVDEGARNGA